MLKPLARTHTEYARVERLMEKPDQMTAQITALGKSPKAQAIVVLTVQAIADRRHGGNAIPSLADTIIGRLAAKDSPQYPLSAKQIQVVVRDCCR